MKKGHRKFLLRVVLLLTSGCMLLFILSQLRSNISFFYTTSEILEKESQSELSPTRVGGVIVRGSLQRQAETISFSITDLKNELKVVYSGLLPPLFAEGRGVVAKGYLDKNTFIASEILAKHDEKYMPAKYATRP